MVTSVTVKDNIHRMSERPCNHIITLVTFILSSKYICILYNPKRRIDQLLHYQTYDIQHQRKLSHNYQTGDRYRLSYLFYKEFLISYRYNYNYYACNQFRIFSTEPFIIKACRQILVCLKPVNCQSRQNTVYIVDLCYRQEVWASCFWQVARKCVSWVTNHGHIKIDRTAVIFKSWSNSVQLSEAYSVSSNGPILFERKPLN